MKKLIKLETWIEKDRVTFDWHESPLWGKIQIAFWILLGKKFTIRYESLKVN